MWNISCCYFFRPLICCPLPRRSKRSAPFRSLLRLLASRSPRKKHWWKGRRTSFLGRPLFTDARWLEKAAAGDFASIRRCIGCVNCFTFNERREIQPARVSCTVNPEVLRETEYDIPAKAAVSRRVTVVGGGLAGMECARVLALRGHKVNSGEKSPTRADSGS